MPFVVLPLFSLPRIIVAGLVVLVCGACQHQLVDRPDSDQPGVSVAATSIPEIISSLSGFPEPQERLPAGPDRSVDRLNPLYEKPTSASKPELFSVAVQQVPVSELLQVLAQDSVVKVDVVGDIEGSISLIMENQSLEIILNKIADLLPVRYEVHDEGFVVMQDIPYLHNYEVDYLNMQRVSESRVDLATQVGSIRTAVDDEAQGQSGNNGSKLFVENKSVNEFWGEYFC